jgi:hypothetical protein
MSRVKYTVNGKLVMDSNLDRWMAKPPSEIQHLLKPGASPEPYNHAVRAALLEATLLDADVAIDVTTQHNGWTVSVSRTPTRGKVRLSG